jgi:hypothetical protein
MTTSISDDPRSCASGPDPRGPAPEGGAVPEPAPNRLAPGDAAHHLRRQLLEWIAERPRSYADVLDAWRTSCPRLSIWEDACIDGLVDSDAAGHRVSLTEQGKEWLSRDAMT